MIYLVQASHTGHQKFYILSHGQRKKIITLQINPTKLSLNNIKKCINDEIKTLEDYRFAAVNYLICFCRIVLKKIPVDWATFKNYLTCQVPFEDSLIDVNVNTKEEYKPDKNYEFAVNKYINLHNKEPNIKWSDSYSKLNTLNLEFSENIQVKLFNRLIINTIIIF